MAVLNFSLTVPDEKEAAIISALAYQNGYKDQVFDKNDELVSNPVTKELHVKNWILSVVRQSYKNYNNSLALKTAIDNQTNDGSDIV